MNTLFTVGRRVPDLLGRTASMRHQSILVSAAVVMLVLASTHAIPKDLASRWGIKLLETETLAADSQAEAIAGAATRPPRAT
ncbi:MAG: hypothetical protein ACLUE1_00790 [Adlercreutzia equolifaciens]